MAYTLDNALFQWGEGERRLRDASDLERADLERAVAAVLDELRRRLGSTFTLAELAAHYGQGVDWASDIAFHSSAGSESSAAVDAAFARYAHAAADFAGGRRHQSER